MDNIMPDNLRMLTALSHMVSEETHGEVSLCCRRITRTPEEKSLQDRKHLSALEEILAKKQRISASD